RAMPRRPLRQARAAHVGQGLVQAPLWRCSGTYRSAPPSDTEIRAQRDDTGAQRLIRLVDAVGGTFHSELDMATRDATVASVAHRRQTERVDIDEASLGLLHQ